MGLTLHGKWLRLFALAATVVIFVTGCSNDSGFRAKEFPPAEKIIDRDLPIPPPKPQDDEDHDDSSAKDRPRPHIPKQPRREDSTGKNPEPVTPAPSSPKDQDSAATDDEFKGKDERLHEIFQVYFTKMEGSASKEKFEEFKNNMTSLEEAAKVIKGFTIKRLANDFKKDGSLDYQILSLLHMESGDQRLIANINVQYPIPRDSKSIQLAEAADQAKSLTPVDAKGPQEHASNVKIYAFFCTVSKECRDFSLLSVLVEIIRPENEKPVYAYFAQKVNEKKRIYLVSSIESPYTHSFESVDPKPGDEKKKPGDELPEVTGPKAGDDKGSTAGDKKDDKSGQPTDSNGKQAGNEDGGDHPQDPNDPHFKVRVREKGPVVEITTVPPNPSATAKGLHKLFERLKQRHEAAKQNNDTKPTPNAKLHQLLERLHHDNQAAPTPNKTPNVKLHQLLERLHHDNEAKPPPPTPPPPNKTPNAKLHQLLERLHQDNEAGGQNATKAGADANVKPGASAQQIHRFFERLNTHEQKPAAPAQQPAATGAMPLPGTLPQPNPGSTQPATQAPTQFSAERMHKLLERLREKERQAAPSTNGNAKTGAAAAPQKQSPAPQPPQLGQQPAVQPQPQQQPSKAQGVRKFFQRLKEWEKAHAQPKEQPAPQPKAGSASPPAPSNNDQNGGNNSSAVPQSPSEPIEI